MVTTVYVAEINNAKKKLKEMNVQRITIIIVPVATIYSLYFYHFVLRAATIKYCI